MDFELSEEQRLLKDSVERLVANRYDFSARQRFMQEPTGFSRELWRQYSELGLLGLAFSEKDGGIGGGAVETMIVMEAFGRALALEPYVATTARKDGSGYVIDGAKTLVIHGDCADKLVVSARLAGGQRERSGLGLFLLDAGAAGVTRRPYPTVDGLRAAEMTFAGVRVGADAAIGESGKAWELITKVVDAAIAALAAEAVGAMTAMHELAVEYLKTRKQFGVPIGAFQVLQHRAADMLIALEQARSMCLLATMMADEPDVVERRKAIAATKVQIGRSGRFVGQQAIQLHGGIGMTMEHKVGHYFKRVSIIDTLFGDADHHLAELARVGGLIAAA